MTTPDESQAWPPLTGQPDPSTGHYPAGGYPPPMPHPGPPVDPFAAPMYPSAQPDASAAGAYPTGGYPGPAGYPPPYTQPAYPTVAYGQPGYGQPFPPGDAAAPRNGLGTAALVVGIVGVVLSWTVYGGIILGILAICFGGVGLGRAKRGEATNRSSAMAGLVLGIIAIALLVILVIVGIGLFATGYRYYR